MKLASTSVALWTTFLPFAFCHVAHIRRDDAPLAPAKLLWVNGEPLDTSSGLGKRSAGNPCNLGVTDDVYSCAAKLIKPLNNTETAGPQGLRNFTVPTKTPNKGNKDVILNWEYEVSVSRCTLSDAIPIYIGSTLTCANGTMSCSVADWRARATAVLTQYAQRYTTSVKVGFSWKLFSSEANFEKSFENTWSNTDTSTNTTVLTYNLNPNTMCTPTSIQYKAVCSSDLSTGANLTQVCGILPQKDNKQLCWSCDKAMAGTKDKQSGYEAPPEVAQICTQSRNGTQVLDPYLTSGSVSNDPWVIDGCAYPYPLNNGTTATNGPTAA